jgi:hypothetical protein
MAFSQRELLELQEATDLSAPLNSSVLPRWQRKALAAKCTAIEAQGKTPKKNGSKTPGAKKTPAVRWGNDGRTHSFRPDAHTRARAPCTCTHGASLADAAPPACAP